MKISFVMAAHNEEKIIRKPLDNFRKIHSFDKDAEFLIGLDGCTDKTIQIIKEYPFVKYNEFSGRNGKPFVIDNMIKKAKGDVVIIHDADWIFNVKNKNKWNELKDEFKDRRLGGIAESYPIEYIPEELNKINSFGHIGSLWGNYFWMDFQKKNYSYRENNKSYAKFSQNSFPFLVNIFRRELYSKNVTLGDDFERSIDILKKNYKVLIKEDESFPRMIAAYSTTRLKDIAKQKERTALAREQVFKKYEINVTLWNFYIPVFFHSLKNLSRINNIKGRFALFFWLIIFIIGSLRNKLKVRKKSTKEGWVMRAER